ncbi:hypothetical protein [Nocardia sp. GTS18]|uniref:DUF7373 family lipoprotein n=1 Tax=Nocardia sp. GTS18 TaxID=1778064 RepID=UPI0015EEDDD0|nr:hypothetical protein [Nocardia sp. GTS18]
MHAANQKTARILRIALITAVITLCGGCGIAVEGNPKPGSTPVDLDQIRTGPYLTEPTEYKAGDNSTTPGHEWLRLMEGRRLLNYAIHPMDIDHELVVTGKTSIFIDVLDIPITLGLGENHKRILKDSKHFITGLTARKSNKSLRTPKEFEVGIFRFDSDTEAARSAHELHRATLESGPRIEHALDSGAATHASVLDDKAIDVWQAHGTYVVMISARISFADSPQLESVAKQALQIQAASLDSQQPIPMDDVLDHPLDPGNLMRRAMPREIGSWLEYEKYFGLLQPSGMLHYERDPEGARKKYADTGVDMIARRATTVYRTRDLAAAFELQTFLAQPTKDDVALDPPPGIADAQCIRLDVKDPSRGYDAICAVVYDRYVAVVAEKMGNTSARADYSLQERTAAQYAILKKCG